MIGAAAGAWVQDKTGRRLTVGIGGVISIGAIALCYASDLTANKQAPFFGGKFVEGLATNNFSETMQFSIMPASNDKAVL